MTQFEFYEKQFMHELEGRNRMHTLLQIPFALLVSVISVHAAIIKDYQFKLSSQDVIFIFLTLICLSFLYDSYLRFKNCFYGHLYHTLPFMEDLNQRHKIIKSHYETMQRTGKYADFEPSEEADKLFQKEIMEYYVQATTHNAKINNYRGDQWHMLVGRIATLTVLTAITYLWVHLTDLSNSESKTSQYLTTSSHIDNLFHGVFKIQPNHLDYLYLKTSSDMTEQKKSPPPPPSEAPPIRVIRENGEVVPPKNPPVQPVHNHN